MPNRERQRRTLRADRRVGSTESSERIRSRSGPLCSSIYSAWPRKEIIVAELEASGLGARVGRLGDQVDLATKPRSSGEMTPFGRPSEAHTQSSWTPLSRATSLVRSQLSDTFHPTRGFEIALPRMVFFEDTMFPLLAKTSSWPLPFMTLPSTSVRSASG